ncbi:MAG: iron-sulfur cluster assembly protein [Anaerolineaceae bacterium]|nr:iron-sulfur cluster assembly protein [Anaerolineaceae bacterium]
MDQAALEKSVIEKLSTVIDPETGVDVMRMKLVMDLAIDENGKASYIFRPSSPLCPLAVPLAMMIIKAINEVEDITGQSITVVDYVDAEKLNEILRAVLEQRRHDGK